MAENIANNLKWSGEPIFPGSTVVVFLDEGASGATLGYYGTLRGVCSSTMASNAHAPDRWYYWIHVPALEQLIAVEARNFLVLRDVDGQPRALPPEEVARLDAAIEPCELKFDCLVAPDNRELFGRYRFGICERGLFHFRKCDQVEPTYRLVLPVEGKHAGRSKLTFQVPGRQVLDRSYVLRMLVAVLGCTMPRDTTVVSN